MKNSYLLILAVILLLGSRKQDGIKNILSSVSVDDALNLLKLLGVDENLINGVMGILPELLGGGDMSSVIKKALPLILSFANSAKSSGAEPSAAEYAGTAPVDDFIPDEIKNDLSNYFA